MKMNIVEACKFLYLVVGSWVSFVKDDDAGTQIAFISLFLGKYKVNWEHHVAN